MLLLHKATGLDNTQQVQLWVGGGDGLGSMCGPLTPHHLPVPFLALAFTAIHVDQAGAAAADCGKELLPPLPPPPSPRLHTFHVMLNNVGAW